MKKSMILASIAMLALFAIAVISCSKDEESDNFYNLDVDYRTPMTRSTQMDHETGATQSFGGSSTSLFDIPQDSSECMLYAIIRIAENKHTPITYQVQNKNGEYKQKKR